MKPFKDQSPYERRSRAHGAVAKAIRSGLLVRSSECDFCGKSSGRIFGAHHDYRKPLDVKWLCGRCHQQWDRLVPKNSGAAGWQVRLGPKAKTEQINFRIGLKMQRKLQREADEARRKLADYVRYLIETHPDRKK